jgi:hypothetical protein
MTISASKNLSMMKALEGHFLKATSWKRYQNTLPEWCRFQSIIDKFDWRI